MKNICAFLKFAVGQQGIFAGQVGRFGSTWQLTNPKSVLFSEDDTDPDTFQVLHGAGGLYPIYPLSKGLDSWDLQRMVTFARTVVDDLPEILPAEVRDRQRLPDARQALDLVPSLPVVLLLQPASRISATMAVAVTSAIEPGLGET